MKISLKQLIILLIVFPSKSNIGGSQKPYLSNNVTIYISNYYYTLLPSILIIIKLAIKIQIIYILFTDPNQPY